MYSENNFSILCTALIAFFIYFLPTVVGIRKKNILAIFILNLLLGITGIAWVIALVWAVKKDKAHPIDINSKSNFSSVIVACLLALLLIGVGVLYYKFFNLAQVTASEKQIDTEEQPALPVRSIEEKSRPKQKRNGIGKELFNVNSVLNCRNPEQLFSLYGRENVQRDKLYNNEGDFVGWKCVLYPNTINQADVSFSHELASIKVANKKSNWKFPKGMYIGMPLEDLIKINGSHFQFYGFEWDYDGAIYSWDFGKLQDSGIDVTLHANSDSEVYSNFLGSGPFSTSAEDIEKLQIQVGVISMQKL